MGFTILYYFVCFIVIVLAIAGIQKWVKLPQQKKDTIGIIIMSTFLSLLTVFILIMVFQADILNAESTASLMMLFLFLIIVFIALSLKWYNDKYIKTLNIGRAIIISTIAVFCIAFIALQSVVNKEKESIIAEVELRTTITNIFFDNHKPYFKNMMLADGRYLPMPETMYNKVQLGDSIYKLKKQNFYTVVSIDKIYKHYPVAANSRILSRPQ